MSSLTEPDVLNNSVIFHSPTLTHPHVLILKHPNLYDKHTFKKYPLLTDIRLSTNCNFIFVEFVLSTFQQSIIVTINQPGYLSVLLEGQTFRSFGLNRY